MKYQEVISTEVASFFVLQAGHYLNHARPAGRTLLSVVGSLSGSGLKTTQKPCVVKRTRTALKSILIFRDETTPLRCAKRGREHDRRK